jgi:hypothetical protein
MFSFHEIQMQKRRNAETKSERDGDGEEREDG